MGELLGWLWRDVILVVLVGTVGMALFAALWFGLRLGVAAPRPFLLLAGVIACATVHPRLVRRRAIAR